VKVEDKNVKTIESIINSGIADELAKLRYAEYYCKYVDEPEICWQQQHGCSDVNVNNQYL
jgi:hypothetical protein